MSPFDAYLKTPITVTDFSLRLHTHYKAARVGSIRLEMIDIIIKENEGDRSLKIATLRKYKKPLVRGIIWALLLTIGAYYLLDSWGETFPLIAWGTPLLVPLLYLEGILFALIKTKWVITNSYIKETGSQNRKVYWKDVKNWHFERDGEKLVITLLSGRYKSYRFVFHVSHNEKELLALFKKHLCKPT